MNKKYKTSSHVGLINKPHVGLINEPHIGLIYWICQIFGYNF